MNLYTAFLHTHKLVVILFLLIYLVKTIFLLIPDKEEALARITKAVKFPEIIISALMLISGIYLLLNTGNANTLLYIKIAAVFISIPLAIIGFKRKIKSVAALSFVLILGAYGMGEVHKKRKAKLDLIPIPIEANESERLIQAQNIFTSNCANCHGADGKSGLSGAANLSISTLDSQSKINIIKNGKNAMPGYGKQLSDAQIETLIEYINTLK